MNNNKTICKNFELNFKCCNCGMSIFNATERPITCETCGGELREVNPINSREKVLKNYGS